MTSGQPFDQNLANQIAQGAIRSQNDFVMEGYPKRKYEVEFFKAIAGSPDLVVVLNAQEALLYSRCQKRLICSQCEHTFSGDVKSLCPHCGATSNRRPEDSDEALVKRLIEYSIQAQEAIPELNKIALRFLEIATDTLAPEDILARIKQELNS